MPVHCMGQERHLGQIVRVLKKKHRVTWAWIKGHAGHAENEEADRLARQGMAPFIP